MAHLGGARERGVLDLIDCENVAIDTSGSFPESNSVEYAVKLLGPRRVVFGSDRPCRDFAVQKGRIMGAEISAEARNLILGGNAARILRLEGVLA
jgi:predicted TIM-barrel fold metal-dependent hydrolase